MGDRHPHAEPLKDSAVQASWRSSRTTTEMLFRTIYTVKLQHAVYVLHAFRKKSRRGIETPRTEIRLLMNRLRRAEAHHAATFEAP
jgi:phage-related protein